jgi:CRISPR-associated protein Csx10
MITRYVPYTLTLRAPVIVTTIGGDPNSSQTLPFVPGSALRGAVARSLGDPERDATKASRFRDLVLGGRVRYLHAYPRAGGRRALPKPLSLHVEKGMVPAPEEPLTARDLMADDAGAALVPLPEPFVTLGAAQPLRVRPRRGTRIHQQRDRARGRAWTEVRDGREEAHGTIFVYEFLEPGQNFDGFVLIEGENDRDLEALIHAVRSALSPPLLLGRSRRGGYGGDADIVWRQLCGREIEGEGVVRKNVERGAHFRALLTSAYIGRNPVTGQIDPTQLDAELCKALRGRIRILGRCWAFDRVGGFNRKWRLELPQAHACAAGSVLLLEATEAIPVGDLLAVEHRGLGERRIEGYGRVVFLEEPVPKVVLRPVPKEAAARPDGEPPEIVRFAEQRILERALARTIAEEAERLAATARRPPSPSLLARLRNVLRGDPEQAIDTLRTWVGQDGPGKLRRPAMDQLDRCRIGESKERLSDWIRKVSTDDEYVAGLLRIDALVQRNSIVSEESARSYLASRRNSMRTRLIDALLAALARKRSAKSQKEERTP